MNEKKFMTDTSGEDVFDCVIIGAGVAGATCADRLQAAGWRVAVVDKARGPSGRLSARRSDFGTFDHGAPLFRASTEQFKTAVAKWQAAGWVAAWQPTWGGDHAEELAAQEWFVPVPRSSALCRHLLGSATTFFGQPVTGILRETVKDTAGGGGFVVVRSDDSLLRGKRVVLATPAPQTAPLLADCQDCDDLAQQVAAVPFVGTWAAMMTFDEPLSVPWQTWRNRHGVVATATRDASKPERTAGERVVVHANPEWSQDHIDASNDEVAAILRPLVADIVGTEPVEFWTHRWRYAHALQPLGTSHLLNAAGDLAIIGDWCLGAGVGAAWASADALLAAWGCGDG